MKPRNQGPRHLIVLADGSQDYVDRLECALKMAAKFDAHLTGVFMQKMNLLPNHGKLMELPPKLRRSIQANWRCEENNEACKAQALFWEKVQAAGREPMSQWKQPTGNADKAIAQISRYADLIIAGQKPTARYQDYLYLNPARVAKLSSCPVMVTPRIPKSNGIGHALLGWDGSREAARALADAMMILEPETKFTIGTLPYKAKRHGDWGFDLEARLKLRGICTQQVEISKTGRNWGRTLVKIAGDLDADLIVMGARRCSRWRQKIFGGITASVLRTMTTPVLLSS
jgi:nucleotide-binding universal stress UspA family protein